MFEDQQEKDGSRKERLERYHERETKEIELRKERGRLIDSLRPVSKKSQLDKETIDLKRLRWKSFVYEAGRALGPHRNNGHRFYFDKIARRKHARFIVSYARSTGVGLTCSIGIYARSTGVGLPRSMKRPGRSTGVELACPTDIYALHKSRFARSMKRPARSTGVKLACSTDIDALHRSRFARSIKGSARST